ncbi:MAG: tRNA (adenine-N1)-methyltransferase [Chloroflexi bacterium]|nr:tRNA (adenine-N1)-methyltransferase [Chloroflexota bacterium]
METNLPIFSRFLYPSRRTCLSCERHRFLEDASVARIKAHEPVLLLTEDRKRYLIRPKPGGVWYSHQGHLKYDDLIGRPFGQVVTTHLGRKLLALQPTTADLIQHIKRATQIVYPKDAAHLVMQLDLWNGKRVIEAGSGSGGLTLAFARAVMPSGRVYSYEARPEHQRLAQRNIEQLGLKDYVEFKLRDIAEGFDENDVDAVFLDVREAAAFIPQVQAALSEGGMFASLQPTANQVSELTAALQKGDFVEIRVEEILLRAWKPVPGRLRPADRMIAHTGFLIFARKLNPEHRFFWMDKRERRRAAEFASRESEK